MPFRLFVPLPGPFAWIPRSGSERLADRRDRRDRNAAYAAYAASLSTAQQYRRGLAMAVAVWVVIIYAVFQIGPWWGVLAVLLAVANLAKGISVEQARRAAEQDDAAAGGPG